MHLFLKQAKKEAKMAFFLTLFYLFGWASLAYLSPSFQGMFGFPLWFELACFYFPVVFILLMYFVIHHFFQDIPLVPQKNEQYEHQQ